MNIRAKEAKASLKTEAKRLLSAGYTQVFSVGLLHDEEVEGFRLKYDTLKAEDRASLQNILKTHSLGIQSVDVTGSRYDWKYIVDVVFDEKNATELP